MEKKNTWETYSSKQLKELEKINAKYRDFLDNGKTERECIDTIVNTIEKSGYRELESLIKGGAALKTGDKVYSVWMNKSIAMFQIGRKPMTEGMNILGAHIDSPRLDVKQNPLYEDGGFAYLDTHYYGGVKKYQWVTIPLAIHGVIVKKDGTCVEINIGENEDDPVFFVSDLLIHLAQEQLEKKAAKVIEGEALDIIVGNKPLLPMCTTADTIFSFPTRPIKKSAALWKNSCISFGGFFLKNSGLAVISVSTNRVLSLRVRQPACSMRFWIKW